MSDKKCCRCGCWKVYADFHRNRYEKDGHRPECGECKNTADRNARARRMNSAQVCLAICRRRPWLTREELFLGKHYVVHGPTWCADRLGRTPDGVKAHWYGMGRRKTA